ncbi:MAG: alpha-galactosidase [Lentisphaerae bacterium]|nr:alpha-galactosidase [Lentisphaerota bacterium]
MFMTHSLFAAFFAAVNFVECPKCDKRIRISEDGRDAFVNMSRIAPERKEEMKVRAEMLLGFARPVEAANPKTPLMGWSSWNTFAEHISEEIIVGVAKTMATNGLKAAGYVYVNIDDGFFDGHGPDGRLRFNPRRFPNGMKGTVDGIHALGMKAGTYSDAGANTCASYGGDKSGIGSGLYGHDAADCQLHFNELGFDFFKVDYCGGRRLHLEERARYTEIANAIKATGRKDVRLNICRWAFPGTWAAELAGSWRTTRDIRASWKSVSGIIAENLYLSAYASPGHFNDLDMLEVAQIKGAVKSAFGSSGDVGMTLDEEAAHFGMWCIMSSPLVLGNDVRIIPPSTMKLVTNPFLLHMNQDPLGLQAYVASRDGEAYVLVKDADTLFGKSRYVALYNAGETEHEFAVKASDIDLGGKIAAFDLMERADVGEFENEVSVRVRPHAAKFFRFDAERRIDRSLYEAETAYLTDYSEIDDSSYGSTNSCVVQGRAYYAPAEGASGGVAVVNLGARESNDLIWKSVNVSESGKYRLTFRCFTPEPRKFYVQIDGGAKSMVWIGKGMSGFGDTHLDVELEQGIHSVRITNAYGKAPDIDFMRVERCLVRLSGCWR